MKTLRIQLQNHGYPISIGSGLAQDLSKQIHALREQSRTVAYITDETVHTKQQNFFDTALRSGLPFILPSGEAVKSFEYLHQIYDFLTDHGFNRDSVLFAVGGGVVGDLVGFAASTFMRGVALYQVPTTLLAMVDSSIGGKTAINLSAGKNLVGSFYHPHGVYIDLNLLKTLPEREFASGIAEVIKYGLIANSDLLETLIRSPKLTYDNDLLASVVYQCCQIKANIVQADEKEVSGQRAFLNLGHTFAHAIENVSGYGTYLHGEAVGIGLLMAARFSVAMGNLSTEVLEALSQLLKKYQLPVALKEPLSIEKLMDAMSLDKKNKQGRLTLVLLREIGSPHIVEGPDCALIKELWLDVGAKAI